MHNEGYASPTNPRGAALILRNTANGQFHWCTLNADPRRWEAGKTTTAPLGGHGRARS
ncbi:DUF4832 domain-containing protein [Kibdelosporangium phytohabitans]|uniref:DUF4832 domain-containing protein n=1 Tax=Kibdelosporangium phytohabitans TaxID=860235 RepID=UPI003AADBEB5